MYILKVLYCYPPHHRFSSNCSLYLDTLCPDTWICSCFCPSYLCPFTQQQQDIVLYSNENDITGNIQCLGWCINTFWLLDTHANSIKIVKSNIQKWNCTITSASSTHPVMFQDSCVVTHVFWCTQGLSVWKPDRLNSD